MNANMSYLALGEKERVYLVFGHSAPVVSLGTSDNNIHRLSQTHARLTVRLRSRWHGLSKPNNCLSFSVCALAMWCPSRREAG